MNGFLVRARSALLHLALAAATIAGLAALAPTTLAAQVTQASTVTAKSAWVREAPASRKVTAVFLVLENSGAAARSLLSGTADVADTLELHEMKREGGMMAMSPVKEIVVPARGQVELRPGGLHLMLFGLKKPLLPGETVKVTLTFDDGSTVAIAAPVRAMGQMP